MKIFDLGPWRRVLCLATALFFSVNSTLSYAQAAAIGGAMPWMPQPGTLVSVSETYTPAHLKGMVIHPNDPFKFDFIIHRGDVLLEGDAQQAEYQKLIKYFLAALAIPDTDQWVNLSPYEQDRIIPDNFGLTEMGRDLLAQDYLLKQIASSLTNPDSELGKKFWDGVYEEAYQKFGTTDVPTDVFNKVWIMPDKAVVYEKDNTVFVLESHLKVMTETDYLAMKNNQEDALAGENEAGEQNDATQLSLRIMREVIIPAIEREVNEGKNFAPVRQVFSGMLLATWYKMALKESILTQVYGDRSKVKGIDQDPATNQEIYQKYVEAFKTGVFNMIKEDVDRYSQEVIPRKYFSGGWAADEIRKVMERQVDSPANSGRMTSAVRNLGSKIGQGLSVLAFVAAALVNFTPNASAQNYAVMKRTVEERRVLNPVIQNSTSIAEVGETGLRREQIRTMTLSPGGQQRFSEALLDVGYRSLGNDRFTNDEGVTVTITNGVNVAFDAPIMPEILDYLNGISMEFLTPVAIGAESLADRQTNAKAVRVMLETLNVNADGTGEGTIRAGEEGPLVSFLTDNQFNTEIGADGVTRPLASTSYTGPVTLTDGTGVQVSIAQGKVTLRNVGKRAAAVLKEAADGQERPRQMIKITNPTAAFMFQRAVTSLTVKRTENGKDVEYKKSNADKQWSRVEPDGKLVPTDFDPTRPLEVRAAPERPMAFMMFQTLVRREVVRTESGQAVRYTQMNDNKWVRHTADGKTETVDYDPTKPDQVRSAAERPSAYNFTAAAEMVTVKSNDGKEAQFTRSNDGSWYRVLKGGVRIKMGENFNPMKDKIDFAMAAENTLEYLRSVWLGLAFPEIATDNNVRKLTVEETQDAERIFKQIAFSFIGQGTDGKLGAFVDAQLLKTEADPNVLQAVMTGFAVLIEQGLSTKRDVMSVVVPQVNEVTAFSKYAADALEFSDQGDFQKVTQSWAALTQEKLTPDKFRDIGLEAKSLAATFIAPAMEEIYRMPKPAEDNVAFMAMHDIQPMMTQFIQRVEDMKINSVIFKREVVLKGFKARLFLLALRMDKLVRNFKWLERLGVKSVLGVRSVAQPPSEILLGLFDKFARRPQFQVVARPDGTLMLFPSTSIPLGSEQVPSPTPVLGARMRTAGTGDAAQAMNYTEGRDALTALFSGNEAALRELGAATRNIPSLIALAEGRISQSDEVVAAGLRRVVDGLRLFQDKYAGQVVSGGRMMRLADMPRPDISWGDVVDLRGVARDLRRFGIGPDSIDAAQAMNYTEGRDALTALFSGNEAALRELGAVTSNIPSLITFAEGRISQSDEVVAAGLRRVVDGLRLFQDKYAGQVVSGGRMMRLADMPRPDISWGDVVDLRGVARDLRRFGIGPDSIDAAMAAVELPSLPKFSAKAAWNEWKNGGLAAYLRQARAQSARERRLRKAAFYETIQKEGERLQGNLLTVSGAFVLRPYQTLAEEAGFAGYEQGDVPAVFYFAKDVLARMGESNLIVEFNGGYAVLTPETTYPEFSRGWETRNLVPALIAANPAARAALRDKEMARILGNRILGPVRKEGSSWVVDMPITESVRVLMGVPNEAGRNRSLARHFEIELASAWTDREVKVTKIDQSTAYINGRKEWVYQVTFDAAMESVDYAAASDPNAAIRGGIDFAQANLDMQIKRDGAGVPLPISQQNLDGLRIDGLVPVILDIKPAASMPLFTNLAV